MTRTLPLHAIPAARMKKLTDKARHDSFKAKLQRWVERNIIADDPRSQEEQMRDESDPARADVGYIVFAAVCIVIVVGGWWAMNS